MLLLKRNILKLILVCLLLSICYWIYSRHLGKSSPTQSDIENQTKLSPAQLKWQQQGVAKTVIVSPLLPHEPPTQNDIPQRPGNLKKSQNPNQVEETYGQVPTRDEFSGEVESPAEGQKILTRKQAIKQIFDNLPPAVEPPSD